MGCALAIAIACSGAFVSAASAADRKVTIKNATRFTMTEFYASTTGTSEWEEDILGADELLKGEEIEIDVDDGSGACKYDFMGVFDDGDKVVKKNINVCTTGTFTFSQ